ncbi:hypothetical protein JMUB7545_27700 [Staphylococcus aureus]
MYKRQGCGGRGRGDAVGAAVGAAVGVSIGLVGGVGGVALSLIHI